MTHSCLLRVAVAPFVLPHELAHALPAAVAGYDWTVRLLPDWDGAGTPLGQFYMATDDTTSLWLIRLVALTPLSLYLGVGVALRLVGLEGPVALVAILFCAFAGTLSSGDLAVATQPAAARESEKFIVTLAGWERPVSDLLAVTTTLVISLIVVG